MKNILHTLCICALLGSAKAQIAPAPYLVIDTLIIEDFAEDPTASMAMFPLGDDTTWVNFDADGNESFCIQGDTPSGWYYESDLGEENSENWAYTSCSYTDESSISTNLLTANWLILPPVLIPDSLCKLRWKSLSLYGPAFLDGYKVVVSTTSNDPTENAPFTDTLFTAAEMVRAVSPSSTYESPNLDDYIFSEGYIHAASYTNSAYFTPIPTGFMGKLEPHELSLAQYKGKRIYIAFVHDSNNDFLLQLDDIVVVDDKTSAQRPEPANLRSFEVLPNPVRETARISWRFEENTTADVAIYDAIGRVVFSKQSIGFADSIDLQSLRLLPGYYSVVLTTSQGIALRKFVKM